MLFYKKEVFMISRIRENFAQFVESMNVKKEEILKQNKFISLENL